MSFHENLKLLRNKEGLTQEEMAAKLGYESINGYAKVERGESLPNKARLKKIAEILETDVEDLLSSHEGNNFTMKGKCHHNHQGQTVILLSETECAHELEKAQMLLQEKNKEIGLLNEQINQLKEIIALMKTSEKP